MKNVKAFAYLRVSSDGQAREDRNGYARQEEAIEVYAAAHGITIIETYRDGHTGTTDDRPALFDMLTSLKMNGHEVKTVVIERLDRLARDLMVQEAIIRDFTKEGFQLISTAEGKDLGSDEPTRKLIRQVMGAVSEYEKSTTVAKLRAARQRKKRLTGKCEGRKSYAEERPEIVQYISRLRRKPKYGKRRTYQQIADHLNAEGYITMQGKSWSLHRVHRVLNPITVS
jgi:DNA invertase Pin-like site-specific DNA recombinase